MDCELRAAVAEPTEHNELANAVRVPRHGLNAKALLMQAAALAAEEAASIEENTPATVSAQDQQIAKLKAAFVNSGKLLGGIPKRETPIVAFVNTTKIPRATRQQVLQKLAGQHLAMALMDVDCSVTLEEVAAKEDLRKAALKAATEQELKLFKSCMSKASYQNSAARTDASLTKFPPASLPLAQNKPTTSAQQQAPTTTLPPSDNLIDQGGSETAELVPNKRRKLEGTQQCASALTGMPLMDDDIDWSASYVATEQQAAVDTETDPQVTHQQASAFMHDADTAETAGDADAPANAQWDHEQDVHTEDDPEMQTDDGQRHVQHAVAEYVRALLDPFYKAGIVNREMYKLVIKKTVAKILQNHAHAEDTDFLISESEQIQKLVREYIRYAQKKLRK